MWAALQASLALCSASICQGQSPLDAPGEKKITVRSEIARGRTEIFEAAQTTIPLNDLLADFGEVILKNKSLQKDSDGFMLGARVEEIREIDIRLQSSGRDKFNTQQTIAAAYKICGEFVAEIRKLQAQLGIDDEATISAMGVTKPDAFEHYKALLNSYARVTKDSSGLSWVYVSALDRKGRTIWIVDAHRDDRKRFVVRADEILLRNSLWPLQREAAMPSAACGPASHFRLEGIKQWT
jgi:hypothetical protein